MAINSEVYSGEESLDDHVGQLLCWGKGMKTENLTKIICKTECWKSGLIKQPHLSPVWCTPVRLSGHRINTETPPLPTPMKNYFRSYIGF